MGRYVFIPCIEKGQGSGHLRRSLLFAAQLGSAGYIGFINSQLEKNRPFSEIKANYDLSGFTNRILFAKHELTPDDILIFDKKEIALEEYAEYSDFPYKMAIDEGGSARNYFPYLVDMLPLPDSYGKSNIYSPAFMDLPEKNALPADPPEKILVTFGGEDPMGLTEPMVTFLHDQAGIEFGCLTVVKGPLFGDISLPEDVEVWDKPKDLKKRLCEFDLVCTSFGITAFEAVASGVPVILLNPAEYHQSLSEKGGFASIGIVKPSKEKFLHHFSNLKEVNRKVEASLDLEYDDFSMFLGDLFFSGSTCPVCSKSENPVLERYMGKTYFTCTGCGMEYMVPFLKKKTEYSEDYFFTDYKKQYGRTYLEDFEGIKKIGSRRMKHINSLFLHKKKGASILDIGCAFGPFLDAARDKGFKPYGIDVYDKAVEYVESVLHIPARVCSIFDVTPEMFDLAFFDTVTMWFVIEHFQDLHSLLVKINSLLSIGGIFAFSTPNGMGISRRKRAGRFFSMSPDDHFSVWNPVVARSILLKYGFTLRRVRITGHHGERFFNSTVPKVIKGAAHLYSRIRGLGDTFEIYAEKTGDPDFG